MSAGLVAKRERMGEPRKKKRPYLPVYLAHEPPHEPWPLDETVLVIARDGMHGEYDCLSPLLLCPHYHRVIVIIRVRTQVPGAIGRRQNRPQGLVTHTTLRISCDSCQSSCGYARHQFPVDQMKRMALQGGRNSHMGDESLKFIGYAHPGAVIGTDKRDRTTAYKEGRRKNSTHLNRNSRPWNMNARSILHVCHCNAFSIASVSCHARMAKSLLSRSLKLGSCRMRTHAFHNSMARR
jgi:hypothetical protein